MLSGRDHRHWFGATHAERTDTNSLWLTEKLLEIGVEVKLKTIVGDDEARLEETIRDALKRSDIVITTGGLGPTEDDITRQVSARAAGRELVYHDELEADLRERFRRWGREMPEINKRQAFVIDGADVLPNPNGSAVGMMLRDGDKFLVVLPGPPRENQPMFEDHVFDSLKEVAGDVRLYGECFAFPGMGESAVDELIAPIYTTYSSIQTSILFSRARSRCIFRRPRQIRRMPRRSLDELVGKIVEALGPALFAISGETMEEVVGKLLAERGETVAVAESCTGGLIGNAIDRRAGFVRVLPGRRRDVFERGEDRGRSVFPTKRSSCTVRSARKLPKRWPPA